MIERGDGGALVAVSSTSAIHGAQRNHAYASAKTGCSDWCARWPSSWRATRSA